MHVICNTLACEMRIGTITLIAATCTWPTQAMAQCQGGGYGLGFGAGIGAYVAYTECRGRGIHTIVVSDLQPELLSSPPSEDELARLNGAARAVSRMRREDPRYAGWDMAGGGGLSGWIFVLWEPRELQGELIWASHPDSILHLGRLELPVSQDSAVVVVVRRDTVTGSPGIVADTTMVHTLEDPYRRLGDQFPPDPDTVRRHHADVEEMLRGWAALQELFERADRPTGRGYSR